MFSSLKQTILSNQINSRSIKDFYLRLNLQINNLIIINIFNTRQFEKQEILSFKRQLFFITIFKISILIALLSICALSLF